MKKIVTLLFFLSLFSSDICFSQTWKLEAFTRPLFSINFLNENTGWIFDSEIAYKTTDGGYNWGFPRLINNPFPTYYPFTRKFFFIDSLYGWSACNNTEIRRTTNGGNTWTTHFVYYVIITDVFFVDRSTGWAIANETNSPYPTIYKSTNSGLNWFPQSITGNQPLLSIHMIDANTGWIGLRDGNVAKTTNGGIVWTILNFSVNNDADFIRFINSSTGWIFFNPSPIARTTNGGSNWDFFDISNQSERITGVFFTDGSNGWFVTDMGSIFSTSNGGINWFVQSVQNGRVLNFISFKNQNSGYVLGNEGEILQTTNHGNNWVLRSTPVPENGKAVFFNNTNTGWIVTNHGKILKTANSGINWSIKFNNYSSNFVFTDIDFSNDSVGWVSSYAGTILKSTDFGENWIVVQNSGHAYNSLNFVDLQDGWIVGNEGIIAHTTNSGINWVYDSTITTETLNSVCFVNSYTGFVAGGNGTILKTSNAGNNWYTVTPTDSLYYTSVKFEDESTGYVTGYKISYGGMYPYTRRRIYKTSDGGNFWANIYDQQLTAVGVYPFTSIDAFNGYVCVVGRDATIYSSSNGGNTWSGNNSPALSTLYYNNVYVLSSSVGWAVGDNGAVVVSFSPIIGLPKIQINEPLSFSLSQNYPNPFNPVTRIKYDVPSNVKREKSNVKIIVYDILGRELETLVNETKKPGSYEVTWDGSRYVSGVYFYRLITDEYAETKKMVLIK